MWYCIVAQFWLNGKLTHLSQLPICLIQLKLTAFLLKLKAVSLLLEIIFFCFPIQVKLAIEPQPIIAKYTYLLKKKSKSFWVLQIGCEYACFIMLIFFFVTHNPVYNIKYRVTHTRCVQTIRHNTQKWCTYQ